MKHRWQDVTRWLVTAGRHGIPFVRNVAVGLGQYTAQGQTFLCKMWDVQCNKPSGRGSLRLRLIVFFSLFLVAAWLIAALFIWKGAREYIDEFFDTQQMIFAKRLSTMDFGEYIGTLPKNKDAFPGVNKKFLGDLEDEAVSFAVFTLDGKMIMTDGKKGQRFVFDLHTKGFSNIKLAGKKDVWRIVWLNSADGKHIIAVGQEVEYRWKMALDMLGNQILPWLVLLPILLLGLLLLLSRELAPLRAMAGQLRTRSPEDTTPLDTSKIPSEVMPMAESLNAFIARTNALITRERSFVSDAAHELRTPLAGLRVQAQVASQEGIDPEVRKEALQFLRQGTDRCSRLLEQLLALSRLESQIGAAGQTYGLASGSIEWAPLLNEVLQEYLPEINRKQLQINCQIASLNAVSQGYPALISMMLRNLLDNAVRYAPANGQIDIRLDRDRLSIENDTGKLSTEDAARLGERFFRPPGQEETGSGLGLSIVKRIADIHAFAMTMNEKESSNAKASRLFCISVLW